MIYPSSRAALLAVLSAVPAMAVALISPTYWYAGLIVVLLVLAMTAADALAVAPARALDASLEAPRTAFVGSHVPVTIYARLKTGTAVESIVEHDERLAGAPLTAVRRGTAMIHALWLRWSGPFGLVWRQRRMALDRTVEIVPDIRPARAEALRLFRRDANMGEVVRIDTGSGGEFQALTDYRVGMDRRAIDWKASGRHGNLIAKEYRTEINNDLVFAIDSGRLMSDPVDGVPRIDRAISAALTAAFVALKIGDKVSLFGFDARPRVSSGAVSGVQSFGVFQRLAAQLDYSNEETNFTLALTTLGAQLKRRAMIMVFTDFVDPTSAELMLRTAGRLAERHLVLFVLMQDVELEDLASAAPATPDDVSRAVIAAGMLRERRIVVARLQRLGVHIVEAPHARLGTELVNTYLTLKRRNAL